MTRAGFRALLMVLLRPGEDVVVVSVIFVSVFSILTRESSVFVAPRRRFLVLVLVLVTASSMSFPRTMSRIAESAFVIVEEAVMEEESV